MPKITPARERVFHFQHIKVTSQQRVIVKLMIVGNIPPDVKVSFNCGLALYKKLKTIQATAAIIRNINKAWNRRIRQSYFHTNVWL